MLDITLELGSFYLLKPDQSLFDRSFFYDLMDFGMYFFLFVVGITCAIIIIPNEQTITRVYLS